MHLVYDNPKFVYECMQAWSELADAVIPKHQKCVTIDELFLAVDICYNSGSLISPTIMKDFQFCNLV